MAGQTTCLTTPIGTFVNTAGASAAQMCAVGTYQNAPGQTSCVVTLPGTFVNTTGASVAQLCAVGSYQSAAGQSTCTPAAVNFFVATMGATTQTACAAGTYQTSMGQSSCVAGSAATDPAIPALATTTPGVSNAPTVLNMGSGTGPASLTNLVRVLSTTQNLTLNLVRQSASGAIVLTGLNGSNLSFTPLSYQANDSRSNGLYPLGNGQYQVVSDGVAITITPAVQNLEQLTSLLPVGAQGTVNSYGVMSAKINGVTYVVQPDVVVRPGSGTRAAALVTGSDGTLSFVDADGNTQVLHPAFLEPNFLLQALQSIDPAATSSIQLDGTASIRFQGKSWILVPDLTLGSVPPGHAADFWWQEDATRFRLRVLGNWYDSLSQGFSVRQ